VSLRILWFRAVDYKKAVHTVKKASSDTVRLQKKANKGMSYRNFTLDFVRFISLLLNFASLDKLYFLYFVGKQDAQNQLQSSLQDFNTKRLALEAVERNAVRSAFVEERRRFCIFIKCLQPVMVCKRLCSNAALNPVLIS